MSTNQEKTNSSCYNPYTQHEEYFNAVCQPSITTLEVEKLNAKYNWKVVYNDHNNDIQGFYVVSDMYATTEYNGLPFLVVYNRNNYYLYTKSINTNPFNSYIPTVTYNLFSSVSYNPIRFNYIRQDRDDIFITYANELLDNYIEETTIRNDLHKQGILTEGYCLGEDGQPNINGCV